MSGEAELEKDAAALRLNAMAVLAGNAGLALVALNLAASTGAATLQALGVLGILAACAQAFGLHGLRQHEYRLYEFRRGAAGTSPAVRDDLFWALVVPVLLYAFGAGIAVIAGTQRLGVPAPVDAASLAVSLPLQAVLLSAVALMMVALWSLLKNPVHHAANEQERERQQVPRLALTVQTAAGVASAVVAAGAFASWQGGSPDADAYGAALVGLVMAAVAARLSLEIRAALRAAPATAAAMVAFPMDRASPIALETKSIEPAPAAPEAFTSGPKPAAAAQAPAKPGQKPPVVARQPGKRKRR